MALLEDAFEGMTSGTMLWGIGALLVAPMLLPALRPLAKTAIRGGLYVTDTAREMLSEASEQVSDMVAEVRAESGRGNGSQTQHRRERKTE